MGQIYLWGMWSVWGLRDSSIYVVRLQSDAGTNTLGIMMALSAKLLNLYQKVCSQIPVNTDLHKQSWTIQLDTKLMVTYW